MSQSRAFVAACLFLASVQAPAADARAHIVEVAGRSLRACFAGDEKIGVGSEWAIAQRRIESRPPKAVASAWFTPVGRARVRALEADGCVLADRLDGRAARGDWLVPAD